MRVLIFSIGVALVSFAGFACIPALIRPGVPVRSFRQLPDTVARDLNRRGCNVVRGNNVISEDFTGSGQRDWAILCQQDRVASLLIYIAGSSEPAVFGTHGAGLVDDPESARGIRVASSDYVAKHNPGIRPETIPPACIEDGVGMGSSIYCYVSGAWMVLAGAD